MAELWKQSWAFVRWVGGDSAMEAQLVEENVRTAAKCLGYELVRFPGGYQLERGDELEKEIIVASTLELIADFLTH